MSKQIVLSIFADEAAAEAAVETIKAWDETNDDIKAASIGILVLDDNGKVKTHKLGRRSTAKGAGIGLVLAVIAPPTLLAGVIGGGVLGALHHKGLGLKTEDREHLAAELAGGKAAVGILAPDYEAEGFAAKLAELGGASEVLTVSDEDAAEVDDAAPAVEAAEAAAPEEA